MDTDLKESPYLRIGLQPGKIGACQLLRRIIGWRMMKQRKKFSMLLSRLTGGFTDSSRTRFKDRDIGHQLKDQLRRELDQKLIVFLDRKLPGRGRKFLGIRDWNFLDL